MCTVVLFDVFRVLCFQMFRFCELIFLLLYINAFQCKPITFVRTGGFILHLHDLQKKKTLRTGSLKQLHSSNDVRFSADMNREAGAQT